MLRSIRSRLIVSYLLVIFVAMGIAAALALTALDRAFLDVMRENLLAQARRVAQTVESDAAGDLTVAQQAAPQAVPDTPGWTADSEGNSYYARATDQKGAVAFELSGVANYVTTPYTAELALAGSPYSPTANVAAGYETRVIDQQGRVVLELTGDVNRFLVTQHPDSQLPTPDPYLQALNVQPGYHTRVIDEEGVVILNSQAAYPPDALESPTGTYTHQVDPARSGSDESLSNDRYAQLQTNLGIRAEGLGESESASSSLLSRTEVQSALAGEPATELRSYDWAPTRRILYAAYPVRGSDGGVTSVVYIASPLPRFSLGLLPDYFGPQVLGGASLAILMAGMTGYLLARSLTRPLRCLTEAASALARGERAPPIPPTSTDELDTLGTAFNTMNANLAAAHDALAAQAQQREAILHNLADAVLAADACGEIILANPAASALLEIAPDRLREAIQLTLESGDSLATEVRVRDQVVELLTTPLRDEEAQLSGIVAVGHDVTAYRQLDRLRTNFVSDVSHELRTPLTAIRGFIETLQDGAADDPDARARFLSTIAAETDRLTRLTNDLLLLTRADAGRLDLHLAPIDLVAAAKQAIAQLDQRAHEKQVAVTVEVPESPARVLADADRIHQVLVNLLDNALKFTPTGGQVSVSFGHVEALVSCTVTDTGPGIPAEEIPHLFTRFYRGDPSRARSGGDGSGLGLAIAKAIVEAHGGRIWVETDPDQGASFSFTLPPAS